MEALGARRDLVGRPERPQRPRVEAKFRWSARRKMTVVLEPLRGAVHDIVAKAVRRERQHDFRCGTLAEDRLLVRVVEQAQCFLPLVRNPG